MSHPPIWPQISRCQTDHPLLGLGDTTSQYRLPWPSGKQNVKILRRFVQLRLCPLGKQSLINYDLDKKLACLKIHGEIPESYIFWIHDWVISAYDVGVDDSDHNDDGGNGDQKDGGDDKNAFEDNDGGDGDDEGDGWTLLASTLHMVLTLILMMLMTRRKMMTKMLSKRRTSLPPSMVSGLWVRPLLGLFFGTAASNTRLVMISEMIIEKNSHSIIMEPLFTSFCIDF